MQGLMVVGFIVDEILRVDLKNDKVTGAWNLGQGQVNVRDIVGLKMKGAISRKMLG